MEMFWMSGRLGNLKEDEGRKRTNGKEPLTSRASPSSALEKEKQRRSQPAKLKELGFRWEEELTGSPGDPVLLRSINMRGDERFEHFERRSR